MQFSSYDTLGHESFKMFPLPVCGQVTSAGSNKKINVCLTV